MTFKDLLHCGRGFPEVVTSDGYSRLYRVSSNMEQLFAKVHWSTVKHLPYSSTVAYNYIMRSMRERLDGVWNEERARLMVDRYLTDRNPQASLEMQDKANNGTTYDSD